MTRARRVRKPSDLTVSDLFCGAGGSSIGAALAGFRLHFAANHWQLAIENHNSNFPDALHACVNISQSDPERFPSTNLLLASPECKSHTYARGRKNSKAQRTFDGLVDLDKDPSAARSRATMWDVPRFAEIHDYELCVIENVAEVVDWPMYDAWLLAMHALGYDHRLVCFNSMFADTPQSRDRLYAIFWKRGNTAPNLEFRPPAFCQRCDVTVHAIQTWKNGRRVGKYGQQYYYRCPGCTERVEPFRPAAARAIDWAIVGQRIGDRPVALKPATMERIQRGIDKYWRDDFLLDLAHGRRDGSPRPVSQPMVAQTTAQTIGLMMRVVGEGRASAGLPRPITREAPTQTARQDLALLVPLRNHGNAFPPADDAMGTVSAQGNHHGLLVRNCSGRGGWSRTTDDVFGGITTRDQHSVVTPPRGFLASYYGTTTVALVDKPMGTLRTRDTHGLVEPGESVRIEDCTFRMLQPHEIQAAMSFPADYKLTGTQRDRVALLGNAVTPPVMSMLLARAVEALA